MRSTTSIALLSACILTSCNPCVDEVVQQAASSSGALNAIIAVRNCGATSDYSSAVFILRPGEKIPRDRGIVFSADSGHGTAPSEPNGALPITVTWPDAKRLRIKYDPRIRVFVHETHLGDIEIEYAVEPSPKT